MGNITETEIIEKINSQEICITLEKAHKSQRKEF